MVGKLCSQQRHFEFESKFSRASFMSCRLTWMTRPKRLVTREMRWKFWDPYAPATIWTSMGTKQYDDIWCANSRLGPIPMQSKPDVKGMRWASRSIDSMQVLSGKITGEKNTYLDEHYVLIICPGLWNEVDKITESGTWKEMAVVNDDGIVDGCIECKQGMAGKGDARKLLCLGRDSTLG